MKQPYRGSKCLAQDTNSSVSASNALVLCYHRVLSAVFVGEPGLHGLKPETGKKSQLSPQRGREAIPGNPLFCCFPQYSTHIPDKTLKREVLVVTALKVRVQGAGLHLQSGELSMVQKAGSSGHGGGERMALVVKPGQSS